MSLLARIRKRANKSLAWLRGWFHAHVTLRWICLAGRPVRDLSLFARRIPFIERREYSQNGEDGIIAAIFAKIGTTNKYCVEFGVEDGLQCNCRYLLKHKGWTGLLMDGGEWPSSASGMPSISQPLPPSSHQSSIPQPLPPSSHQSSIPPAPFLPRRKGENGDKHIHPPSPRERGLGGEDWGSGERAGEKGFLAPRREFVTAENIESLFEKYGVPQEFDLLSIDIDGNDYWVWKAITNFRPRVVVIEYNANKGPDASVTVPYDPAFVWDKTDYQGASLRALERLGREKGYALIGTDPHGVNAFFVSNELVPGNFAPPEFRQIFHSPAYKGIPGKGHPTDPRGRSWVEIR